jgi:hypothetical protein
MRLVNFEELNNKSLLFRQHKLIQKYFKKNLHNHLTRVKFLFHLFKS